MKQPHLEMRHQKLQQLLIDHTIECLLISNPVSSMYLTGKWGLSLHERELFLVVTPATIVAYISPLIISNFDSVAIEKHPMSPELRLSDLLNRLQVSTIHYEAADLRVAELQHLKSKVRATFTPSPPIIEQLRLIKDAQEIAYLTKACSIAAKAWTQFRPQITPGKTEKQLAEILRALVLTLGADDFPVGFEPIIASGAHSAIPHHQNTDRKIKLDEPVLVDFGCSVRGYASDMTRTIWVGESPSRRFKEIKDIVDTAYAKALAVVDNTNSIHQTDQAVANYFMEKQVGPLMHSLGHGIGLSVHEDPSISRYAKHDTLASGTVLTIEPGLYYPGELGYRYENTVVIKSNQVIELTKE